MLVHQGTVRVTLAGREYEARTGATVFIPHGTWIGVKNASTKAAMIVFIFNKPAFERCLPAMSSRQGQRFTVPSPATLATIRAHCDEMMKK